jgi:hypothetical protein
MFVNVFCFFQKQDKISGVILRYLPMNTKHSTWMTVLWNKFFETNYVLLKTFISIQTPRLEQMEANCNLSESSLRHR